MANPKTNVFDKTIYDSCLTESCDHMTQHKSGYCERCRTFLCVGCKKPITLSNPFDRKKPKCGYCKSRSPK